MLAQQILEESGIPVPPVYGAVDENMFVMDFIEGEKDAGLVQQASEEMPTISPERWQASLEFIEWLGKSHKIPVDRFAGTECMMPSTPEEIALALFSPFYDMVAPRRSRRGDGILLPLGAAERTPEPHQACDRVRRWRPVQEHRQQAVSDH